MIDHTAIGSELCDLEEMIRGAGGYLEVSDDLRPRTLEEARDDGRENSARSWIAVLAVVVVFLATCAGWFCDQISSPTSGNAVVSANCDQLYVVAQLNAAQTNVEASWSLVDAFSELRQRQVILIKKAF